MPNDLICRTKEYNNMSPCFVDDRGECIVITIGECGLDLEGIPENEQTREFLEAARMTGLSTILSVEDAMEVAKKKIDPVFDRDHFRPAVETYKKIYQNHLRQEADRFYENAKGLIQKIKGHQPEKKRSVDQRVDDRPCSEISLFDGCGNPDEAPICKRCRGSLRE